MLAGKARDPSNARSRLISTRAETHSTALAWLGASIECLRGEIADPPLEHRLLATSALAVTASLTSLASIRAA